MSTLIWPRPGATPRDHDAQLHAAIDATLKRELEWLLASLQETLRSLKAGLEECAALLAPVEPGATLVVSTPRSEALKGFVTRVGARIVKGDILIRLPSLPVPRGQQAFRASISQHPSSPTIALEQLTTTRTLINSCLDVVDATQWTGDSSNADFISGQLRLLHENVREAKNALRGGETDSHKSSWVDNSVDPKSFEPALPANVSFHLSISEAALVLVVRTLEVAHPHTGTNTPLSTAGSSVTGLSLRERLTTALSGPRPATHDESNDTFHFKGQDLRVRDKIRVESQDPNLLAALAKLAALERNVTISRKALDVVMGKEHDDLSSS